jgi:hypothetical protein
LLTMLVIVELFFNPISFENEFLLSPNSLISSAIRSPMSVIIT